MMFKKMLEKAVLAGALLFSASSFAGMIVDTKSIDEKVGYWESISYVHDINDDGFALGSAISGQLSINVYDDNKKDCWGWCADLPEVVLYTIEDFDFDTGAVTFGDFDGSLEIEALASLNADGFLDVTVTSVFGDFYVASSTLTVYTAEVPEPASLALLGLGLMGVGFSRRKQKA